MEMRHKIIGEQSVWLGPAASLYQKVADEVEKLLRSQDRVVLGLATGSTPLPLYTELIRRHREEGLSFSQVTSFNLDEYAGLEPGHHRSYRQEMWRNLFSQIDIAPERVHFPNADEEDASEAAFKYEEEIREAGGIDWQFLGIGRDGHIGFNEPGSGIESRTRRIELAKTTREDAVRSFGSPDKVPTHAMTMGVGTILEARRIVLMACGEAKKEIVGEALRGEIGSHVPASFLRRHPNVGWFLDEAAAGDDLE